MGTPQRCLYVLRCPLALKDERAHWKDVFFDLLIVTLRFPPHLPSLMNAGLPQGQLAAYFVFLIEDSLVSIFQAAKDIELIHQSGGGTCFGCEGCVDGKCFSKQGVW